MTSVLCKITPHECPGIVQRGTGASYDIFKDTSSGYILGFKNPAFGCIPLPLNKVGGSTVYNPIFSRIPSIKAP